MSFFFIFFFHAAPTAEIYTLSLHDALPILSAGVVCAGVWPLMMASTLFTPSTALRIVSARSEEHTSELQSLRHLVCRLLLEKKKKHFTYTCNIIPCTIRDTRISDDSYNKIT